MGRLQQTCRHGAGSRAGPQGNEDKHLSTLIAFPLDGNTECHLVLATAIPSPFLYFSLHLHSPLGGMELALTQQAPRGGHWVPTPSRAQL